MRLIITILLALASFAASAQTQSTTIQPESAFISNEGSTFTALIPEVVQVDYHYDRNVLDITQFNADHSTTSLYYGPATSCAVSANKAVFEYPGGTVVVNMKTGDVSIPGADYCMDDRYRGE